MSLVRNVRAVLAAACLVLLIAPAAQALAAEEVASQAVAVRPPGACVVGNPNGGPGTACVKLFPGNRCVAGVAVFESWGYVGLVCLNGFYVRVDDAALA